MRVRSGGLVDLLEFVMADGAVRNGGYPAETGQLQPTFTLDPDEHIIKLETKQQDATLVGLRIHTSKGRESQWFGGQDGATEEFSGSAEDPIVGFERRGDGFCPRIVSIQRLRDTSHTESTEPKPVLNAAEQATGSPQALSDRSVESAQAGPPQAADGQADMVSKGPLCIFLVWQM